MDSSLPFSTTAGLIVLVLVGGLIWLMLRTQRRDPVMAPRPVPRGFRYEWVSTPRRKARRDVLNRFPELAALGPAGEGPDVHLIRLGIFNLDDTALEANRFLRPFTIRFPPGTEILSALFGEALKSETKIEETPRINGNVVELPRFRLDPNGTAIFNLVVRGDGEPEEVSAEIEGAGPPRRLD